MVSPFIDDLKHLRILLCLFHRPVMEIDDPATGRAVPAGIEILAVEIGEQDRFVTRVRGDQAWRFLGFENKPGAQNR